MRDTTIARNYAEALFTVGERHGLHDSFVTAFSGIEETAADARFKAFLESPKIEVEEKRKVLRTALGTRAHPLFLNFVMVVLRKRRQRLLVEIGHAYRSLVEEKSGRLHVQVTLARQPDSVDEQQITEQLSRVLGRTVVPHVSVNREILGGIIVRYGDRVLDGSLRRRLVSLRSRLLEAGLPATR